MISASGTWKTEGSSAFWNPAITANFALSQTTGTEYRNFATGVSLLNTLRWIENWNMTAGADFTLTRYSARSAGARQDTLLGVSAGVNRRLGNRFTVLGDFRFAVNTSNIPSSFSYNRLVAGAGLSYALF